MIHLSLSIDSNVLQMRRASAGCPAFGCLHPSSPITPICPSWKQLPLLHAPPRIQSHGLRGVTAYSWPVKVKLFLSWKRLETSPDPIPSREDIFHSPGKQMVGFYAVLLSPASPQLPEGMLQLQSWLSSLDFVRAALAPLPLFIE